MVHLPQFQPPNIHNCPLIHTNIFKNAEVLQIEILSSTTTINILPNAGPVMSEKCKSLMIIKILP